MLSFSGLTQPPHQPGSMQQFRPRHANQRDSVPTALLSRINIITKEIMHHHGFEDGRVASPRCRYAGV